MGEARKRGSYEQRKSAAIEKQISARILKRRKQEKRIVIISTLFCIASLLYNYFHYFRETL